MGGSRRIPMASVVLWAVLSAGCLSAEVEHDIVIDPDGAATWSVLQRHVVSTESDPLARDREEEAFRRRLMDRTPPIAEALRILGGWRVEVEVLRDDRPFAVAASARFSRVDRMLQEYFDRVHPEDGILVHLDQEGHRQTLRIVFPPEMESPDDQVRTSEPTEDDAALAQLQLGEDNLHFLLTRGRFVEAQGFRIDLEGTRAVPSLGDGPEEGAVLVLSWEDVP